MSTSWFVSCCDCGEDSDWSIYSNCQKVVWKAVKLKREIKELVQSDWEIELKIAGSSMIAGFIAEHSEHELCVTSGYGDVIRSDEDLEAYENR